jgi:hypothetical protein
VETPAVVVEEEVVLDVHAARGAVGRRVVHPHPDQVVAVERRPADQQAVDLVDAEAGALGVVEDHAQDAHVPRRRDLDRRGAADVRRQRARGRLLLVEVEVRDGEPVRVARHDERVGVVGRAVEAGAGRDPGDRDRPARAHDGVGAARLARRALDGPLDLHHVDDVVGDQVHAELVGEGVGRGAGAVGQADRERLEGDVDQ